MKRYSDWAPTSYDAKGLGDRIPSDWLVVGVIRTRDSRELEASNFETAASLIADAAVLDNELSVDTHRFFHWGPGWFEIIVVRPGSHAAKEAERIEARVESYPVLDEDDLSNREWEAAQEAWKHTSLRERIQLCASDRISIFAARRDEIPQGDSGRIQDRLLGS